MPLISARIVARITEDSALALAFAGDDQSVLCASIVQLSGEILGDDPANHTFEWEQTGGTPVTLINANTLTPSFVNPQISDLEFTLYVDRNTPYEDSDRVIISRAPTDFIAWGGAIGTQQATGFATPLTSSTSANMSGTSSSFRVTNPFVTGWAFEYPPESTYSPIFKADDLARMSQNLDGRYWLMNDIDMTGYDWLPLGTPQRPFSGELQGNGYNIQNLSITQPGTAQNATSLDPLYNNTVAILTFNQSTVGSLSTYNEVADLSPSQHNITYGPVAYADDGSLEGSPLYGTYLYCDGNGSRWVDLDASTDFDFGTGDFCIEFWYRHAGFNVVSGLMASGSEFGPGWSIHQRRSTESYGLNLYVGGTIIIGRPMNGVITLGQWSHVAITREGTNLRMFVDGVQQGATVTDSTNITSSGNFTAGNGRSAHNVSCYSDLDEVRITKGAARYTTNFTPPQYSYDANVGSSAGLFAYIGNGAVIEKLGITDANIDITGIDNTPYKGVLAGTAQGPLTNDGGAVTVRDVFVSGTVNSGGDQAGGLIGHTGANASSLYKNTYSDVTVTGGGTSEGGWAGYFDTIVTYNFNYWNSTKTTNGVGTDGDSPIAGELDGRTTAQLNAQANYDVHWDFVNVWEIDEGISPATLQQDITGNIRAIGECDDNWMVIWQNPSRFTGSAATSPTHVYKGAIIEENINGAWGNKRFIPKERTGALLTPDTTHRITTVWDYYPYTSNHYVEAFEAGLIPQPPHDEITITDDRKFTSKNTSPWFGPYGNDAFKQIGGAYGVMPVDTLSINISNPRKITLAATDNLSHGGALGAFEPDTLYIRRTQAVIFPLPPSEFMVAGGGSYGVQPADSVDITRVNGASIGGA